MPADTRVKVGNDWRPIGAAGIYARDGGQLREIDTGHARVNGVWQTTYIRDNTPPVNPTNLKCAWENGGLRITWTNPPDSDLQSMELAIYPRGGSLQARYIVPASPGSQGSYLYLSGNIQNYLIYDVNFRPIDSNGNRAIGNWAASMEFTGSARGRTPSPISFRPIDSGTWDENAGFWRTVSWMPGPNWRVFQGASISRNNWGAMFYGSQFWTHLRGASVSAARLDLQRMNTPGLGAAIKPNMAWSQNLTSKAVNPTTSTRSAFIQGTGMARTSNHGPTYGSTVLPSSWRDALSFWSVGNTMKSIMFYSLDQTLRPWLNDVSESYMGMYGAHDPGPYFGTFPGLIYVVHSG